MNEHRSVIGSQAELVAPVEQGSAEFLFQAP